MHRHSLANTKRHAAVAWAAASMLLLSTTARAQQQSATTFESPPVTLTGTRLPMTPSGMAQTITVIDDKEIQQTNPANVEEALSRFPACSSIVPAPAGFRRCTCVARNRDSDHDRQRARE